MYGPAVWQQTDYKYESLPVPAFGPFHPNPVKSSLLCITTNGLLKLFYCQSTSKVEEVTLELESITSSDDLITHASICSDKSTASFYPIDVLTCADKAPRHPSYRTSYSITTAKGYPH